MGKKKTAPVEDEFDDEDIYDWEEDEFDWDEEDDEEYEVEEVAIVYPEDIPVYDDPKWECFVVDCLAEHIFEQYITKAKSFKKFHLPTKQECFRLMVYAILDSIVLGKIIRCSRGSNQPNATARIQILDCAKEAKLIRQMPFDLNDVYLESRWEPTEFWIPVFSEKLLNKAKEGAEERLKAKLSARAIARWKECSHPDQFTRKYYWHRDEPNIPETVERVVSPSKKKKKKKAKKK